MPYSANHKRATRARIVEAARILFNRHGFEGVTIDAIMEAVGLTRGGFYNHFRNKEELYGVAVASFLTGRGEMAKKFQAKRVMWLNVNLALAVLMVLIGGFLRFVGRDLKTEKKEAAKAAQFDRS